MFDIDAAVESRRSRLRLAGAVAPASGGGAWSYANDRQLHRRWLALYRGDRWTLQRIAELDSVTIAQVWCGIVLAMRREPRKGVRRSGRRAS